MTDCAWTSAFTGLNPGAHGIFGSYYRAPGAYACRYFSARDRRAPAAWELSRGVRWLVWNVPMTYPPEAIEGTMLAGYGAPPGARISEPESFRRELEGRWDLGDLLDRAPHGSLEGFRDDLLRGLEVQAEALPWAIRATGADCVAAVWPHVDRVQHFFWRFRDTKHRLSGAVDAVYEAMDRATARVMETCPDADVIIVSDHGAGPLRGDVNLGAWLARNGHAVYGRPQRNSLVDLAWAMPPSLRRVARRAAPVLVRKALEAKLTGGLGSFDWSRTTAFVGWHGDLWLNLEGREPLGRVSAADADEVLDELAGGLSGLTDPATGGHVFSAVHRRDDIYSGPAAAMGPDLMLDSWSAGYRVAPGREMAAADVARPAALAGVKEPWSADHRPLGIFAAAGPRIQAGSRPEHSLLDVCPTALALLEQPVPAGLDGRVVTEALKSSWLERHPLSQGPQAAERQPRTDPSSGLSSEEAGAVAGHLKDLGYID